MSFQHICLAPIFLRLEVDSPEDTECSHLFFSLRAQAFSIRHVKYLIIYDNFPVIRFVTMRSDSETLRANHARNST